MKTDIIYRIEDGLVTFFPNTPAGESAWRVLHETCGEWNVPAHWLPSILSQLKTSGYTVRRGQKRKPGWTKEDQKLWEELQS